MRFSALLAAALTVSVTTAFANPGAQAPLRGMAGGFGLFPEDSPEGFGFGGVNNAPVDTLIASDTATMHGLENPVEVSVAGDGDPQISVDGGAWTTEGEIGNGQTLAVRLTSAPSPDGTMRMAIVKVGGGIAPFSVSTIDQVPEAFTFPGKTGVAGAALIPSDAVSITGLSVASPVAVSGEGSPEISIDGGPWSANGEISAGQAIRVRLTSAPFVDGTIRKATVDIGGEKAVFEVATADGTPDGFWFDTARGVALGTVVESQPAIVADIDVPVQVTVAGEGSPEISIDGGPWASSGTITNGQELVVRMISAGAPSTTARATVTAGTIDVDFDAITGTNFPEPFAFAPVTNAVANSVTESDAAIILGTDLPSDVVVSGEGNPEVSIDEGPWTVSGRISRNGTLRVRLTSANGSNGETRTASVDVSGRRANFVVTTVDTTPDPFSYEVKNGAELSAWSASEAVRISGITAPTSVEVTGGEVSIAGGAWAGSGMISDGETLAVRLTSASTISTARTATVTVGGVSADYTVTTGDAMPDAFSFAPVGNATGGSRVTSETVTIGGLTLPAPVSVIGGEVSISGGAWGTSGTIANGETLAVRLVAAPGIDGGNRSATVTAGGVDATFVVTTIDTTPDAFALAGRGGVPIATEITSAPVSIDGLSAPALVTATNDAEVSIDGGAFAESGLISSGESLAVRLMSSASPSTTVSTTVTVGGVSDSFSVTTGNNVPDAFAFAPVANAAGGSLVSSAPISISGLTLAAAVSVTGGEVSVDGGAWTTTGTISDGQTLAVRLTSAPGTNGGSRTASVTVGGVAANFTVTTIDTTPAAFGFTATTGVPLSTLTTSAGVPISGITAPASVTVAGGDISVNGGAWATSDTIENGETLALRLTSAATASTTRTATVTVGGISAAWSVTTGDDVPDAFSFAPAANATGGSTVTSAPVAIEGLTLSAPVSVTGGEISVAGGAWTTSGTIADGQSLAVRLTAAPGSNGGSRSATVSVGGVGATFVVTTIDTTPDAFSFTDQTGVALSSATTSGAITVNGLSAPAVVTATNGATFSIGGAAFGSSGTISNGEALAVRLTSSASPATAVSTTVTVGGVSDSFSVTTGNDVPDAFSFAPVANAVGGSTIASAPVTIEGLTLPAAVSVSGGEISVAGGAWAASGSITNGQTLAVRLTSAPGTNGGSRTASVTVGGVAANFTVTTIDTTPAPFGFAAKTGVTLSTLTTSTGVPISGITAPAPVTVTGGEISVNGGAWANSGTISNGDSLAVRMTSAATPATDKSATVTVGGVTASWTVTTGTNMPDAFGFTPVTNAAGGSLVTSPGATITGITLPVPVSVAGDGNPQISIAGGAWATSGTVTDGQSVAVRLTSAAGTNGGTHTATVTVGGATADFDVTTIDTTPAAFGFAARTGVALLSLSSSDTVTISGITAPANVTVTGGEISIAGGSWVTSGTISSGETLAVRLTSSAAVSTATTATVTVGGVAA
ncbi:hypothetical protein LAZ40_01640, partial [Cereibacter sphaeroides]|uniref:beta strand repeat-containing protein n=1 Tax=Cereibacter sphaeroides TaxID=1063 RepID=UPI001F1F8650